MGHSSASNLHCRRADEADVEALIAFPDDPGLHNLERDQVRADFAAGRMRPQWSWLIEDAGALVGRALWWGRGETVPSALDTLDVLPGVPNRRLLATELLRQGIRLSPRQAWTGCPSTRSAWPGAGGKTSRQPLPCCGVRRRLRTRA